MRIINIFALCAAFLLVSLPFGIEAQPTTCPIDIDRIMTRITENCDTVERNSVCFGNARIDSETLTENDRFSELGDLIGLDQLVSLRTYPLSIELEEWGIAVFRLQTDLEGTIPGQVVTLVAFGDTEITPDEESESLNTMESFYFTTGIGSPQCADVPEGGLLIQNGRGSEVTLTINDFDLTIGSTALFTAETTDQLTITTLEGNVSVTIDEETQDVPAGFTLTVSADEPPEEAQTAPDITVSVSTVLPEPVPELGEPTSTAIGLLQCSFSGGVNVAANSDVYLRGGWADTELNSVIDFAANTPPSLEFDGNPIFYSYRDGPSRWSNGDDNGFMINWYWLIEDIEAGEHTAVWEIGDEKVTCQITAR